MSQFVDDQRSYPRPVAAGGRVPPNNIPAEESLLGAMLLSPDAVSIAAELCVPEDFYRPLHGQIFGAIVDLIHSGREIDWITVSEKLAERGVTDLDPSLLNAMQINTPSAANAQHYANIVRDKSRQRKLIEISGRIADEAYLVTDDVDGVVDTAERMILEVRDTAKYDSVSSLVPLLIEELNLLEERAGNKGAITGIETGYRALDSVLRGLNSSSLTIVGARPSVGKTAFALGILLHVGSVMRRPALYFSLEMSRTELAERILATKAQIDSSNLKVGNLNDNEWSRAQSAINQLHDAPIFVDDNPNLTVMDVRARARRIKQQQGDLGIVIVDYLQLMSSRGRTENRQVEVAEMSRGLKILARELQCPVIALSQLSRGLESRTDKRPMMSDLRESGSLEQDADVVLFLYRPELYDTEITDKNRGIVEVIVSKHRNGPIGTANLVFLSRFARFDDMGDDLSGN
jgi:replicative DNA helicase